MTRDYEAISYFHQQFGNVADAARPDADSTRGYPEFLQMFWQEVGFGSRTDGFVWLVNPQETSWLVPMFDLDRSLIPFARTSFGDFHLFDPGGHFFFFSPNHKALMLIAESFYTAIMTLSEAAYIEDDVLFARHQKMWEEGNRINATTCFCLNPAIALGGDELTSEIYVGDLQTYCHLLSQA